MIHVNERYAIGCDERNYTVYQKSDKLDMQTGEPRLNTVAYCQSMAHCIECIYKRETKAWIQKHDSDLKTALEAFREIKKDIVAAVEGAERP